VTSIAATSFAVGTLSLVEEWLGKEITRFGGDRNLYEVRAIWD